MPIAKIPGKLVLDAALEVEKRGALDMARRVLSAMGMVFKYAVGTGSAPADPTNGLVTFMAPKRVVRHHPHVEEDGIPAMLLKVERYHGRPETRLALKIMMRTFPRTSELRWAEWSEFDLEQGMWLIPGQRMKGTIAQKEAGIVHEIPLSRQVVALLKELRTYSGRHRLIFPGIRSPSTTPISAETMNKALKIMGYEKQQTGHGFRGLASTIMNEYSGFRPDAIERQLSHKKSPEV